MKKKIIKVNKIKCRKCGDIPTSFYVDGSGKFMETKFSGTYPEMYEDVLIGMLDQI